MTAQGMRLAKRISITLFFVALLGGGYWFYVRERGPIYEFSYSRDADEILKILERDHYWLIPYDEYYPDIWLKYRSPNQFEPRYFGQLQVKVLRENDHFIGFTTYYLKYPTLGHIQFVAINPEYRGKRYGEKLVNYVLADLKAKGAKQVQLLTRISNERAQKLYKRIGFYETSRDEEFVYFTKDL